MTNEEMVVLFQQGKLEFEEIVEKNRAMIQKELKCWDGLWVMEYEDKQNLLLLKFWEACVEFDVEAGFKFSTLATNKMHFAMKNIYRATKSKRKGNGLRVASLDRCLEECEGHYFESFLATEYDFLDDYHVTKILDVVERVLERYDELRQEYVRLFLYEKMSYTEIARRYDKKPTVMRTIIRRVLEKVELELKANGLC